MKRTATILLLLILASGAWAADAPVLTLEQAIARALADNAGLAAAEAAAGASRHELDAARASRMPGVELGLTAMRTTNPVGVFGGLLNQESFAQRHFDPAFLNEPDALDDGAWTLRLSQPLYTGGRIPAGIAASDALARAAGADHEQARQRVVHAVIEAYSGAVLAARHVDVAREALATSEEHVRLVGDLLEGGLVVESDLLQAKVRSSEVRELLINAESGLAVAKAGLNLAMGAPQSTPLALPLVVDEGALEPAELDTLVAEAAGQRPELEAARQRAEAARYGARAARGSLLPEVGAGATFENHAQDFVGSDGTSWTVALAARWQVFDGGRRRAKAAAAERKAAAAAHAATLATQQVELEVRRAFHALGAARQRLAVARDAVTLAEAGLRIIEDRYQNGLTTLVPLLDAETALTAARTREVAAHRDLLLSHATLKLAVGRL